ncbi:MAG: hypothetical protein JWM20_812 [Patescibacteria group bacterium]|nr:hypothetical protein [Patescibacteria group bacterium]
MFNKDKQPWKTLHQAGRKVGITVGLAATAIPSFAEKPAQAAEFELNSKTEKVAPATVKQEASAEVFMEKQQRMEMVKSLEQKRKVLEDKIDTLKKHAQAIEGEFNGAVHSSVEHLNAKGDSKSAALVGMLANMPSDVANYVKELMNDPHNVGKDFTSEKMIQMLHKIVADNENKTFGERNKAIQTALNAELGSTVDGVRVASANHHGAAGMQSQDMVLHGKIGSLAYEVIGTTAHIQKSTHELDKVNQEINDLNNLLASAD